MLEKFSGNQAIMFDYINYRGEKSSREARIISFYFGSTEYHKEEQWLMKARDFGKQEERIFAMKDMSNVRHYNAFESNRNIVGSIL